jgi:transposase InsO family protein
VWTTILTWQLSHANIALNISLRFPVSRFNSVKQQHAHSSRSVEQIHLILVDQYSGWSDVIPFKDKNTTARRIVDASREFFVHGPGAPVRVWSDNNPQFNAMEFTNFAKDLGFSTGTSSPHYPQSNRLAEAAVKSMKKLIAGSWTAGSFNVDKFAKSLLLFRNAPRSGAASPAQMVLNRPVRDALPAHRRSFAPEWQQKTDVLEKKDETCQRSSDSALQ